MLFLLIGYEDICKDQAWGQSTRYFGTFVLEYRFFKYSSVLSTRTFEKYLYSYLYSSTFKNESTCTQVLLKMKVLLPSTYEYLMSTSHLKLI